jgi:hypothetical protein
MELVTNRSDAPITKKAHSQAKVGITVAPGAGKLPTNLMREPEWDIHSFPTLFPSGKFGMNYPRKKKLTPHQYILQRLLNQDKSFSSYPPFVFASVGYREPKQFESQINIAMRKGKIRENVMCSIEDGFDVFDKVLGTPRYWQTRKYEMIAKLEQLGSFQFFFTLSCADKRWPEHFCSILLQKGLDVTYDLKTSEDGKTSETIIKVGDISMEEYLATTNLTTVVRDEVLLIARSFDHRVRTFVTHVLMGHNSPMHVQYYSYRVEFQQRGAGHIHGVIWCSLKDLEADFPNITTAMSKLRTSEILTHEECETMVQFVDKFISCSLTNEYVAGIVRAVQMHVHTHTCQKYGKECRFGYPRLPSDRTIIALPLNLSSLSDKAAKEMLKKYESILSKVKTILKELTQDDAEEMSISDLLTKAAVSSDEYYEALGVSRRGITIILKRRVAEMNVNNYNAEWINVWNGNLDIQVCLDFFAVITYITDYYSKADAGMMAILLDAARAVADKTKKEKMLFLANTFLTHRQMGLFEAYYRLIPGLHLTHSNLKCVFLSTGFKQNRCRFLQKVFSNETETTFPSSCPTATVSPVRPDPDNPGPTDPDITEGLFVGQSFPRGELISIEGHEGKFRATASIHDKYENRPLHLTTIVLAQFVTVYETFPDTLAKKSIKNG